MSESNSFESSAKEPAQSAQEVLKLEIDTVLDEYFLLLSRRGLDIDTDQLNKKIIGKRQVLFELTQKFNNQLDLDNIFSEKIDTELNLAEKGIETGKEELEARSEEDNIEAIVADMKTYGDELNRIDLALDTIKSTLENKNIEKEEIELLVLELKTMIKSFMNIAAETQKLILSLKVNSNSELVQKQMTIMNNVIGAIKNFDETSNDKEKLDKIKDHFYTHFDEALHFYEELRDLTK